MTWTTIARDQHGVISRRQLLGDGLTRHQVDWLANSGRLTRTHLPGVLQITGSPIDSFSLTWTMVLASGSPLSFASAARVWSLPVEQDGLIHVTRPDRRKYPAHRLLRVHRCALADNAVVKRRGLPVTARSETLLDCLGQLPQRAAADLLDRAFQQRWLDSDVIERRLRDQPGRWGNSQLRRLLDQSEPGAEARSERLMAALLRSAGIVWVDGKPAGRPRRAALPDRYRVPSRATGRRGRTDGRSTAPRSVATPTSSSTTPWPKPGGGY